MKKIHLFFSFLFCSSFLYSQDQLKFINAAGVSLNVEIIHDYHFKDVNNDSFPDLVLAYEDVFQNYSIEIYRNNGRGEFHEKIPNNIQGFYRSKLFLEDVDLDGDLDMMVVGRLYPYNNNHGSYLYLNNGGGRFVRDSSNSFRYMSSQHLSVLVEDFDGDQDMDILMGGIHGNSYEVNLYENTGNANYQLNNNHGLTSMNDPRSWLSSDFDNDGYLDLMLVGLNSSNNPINKLYRNNRNGTFSNIPSSFPAVRNGSMIFVDINGDSYEDLIFAGLGAGNNYITGVYMNDSLGSFTARGTLAGASGGVVSVADFDGDNDMDLLMQGQNNCRLLVNNGSGYFSSMNPLSLSNFSSPARINDLNGDGKLDIVIKTNVSDLHIFYQDSILKFKLRTGSELLYGREANHLIVDLNNDSLLDLAIAAKATIEIYINGGDYKFKRIYRYHNSTNTQFSSSLAAGDVNNDGFNDILVGGVYWSDSTVLLLNDSGRSFAADSSIVLTSIYRPDVHLFDLDGDLDLDILLQGGLFSSNTLNEVYINNGSGSFVIDTVNFNFPDLIPNSTFQFDVDGDNDLDLIFTGVKQTPTGIETSYIFKQGPAGAYTRHPNYSIVERIYDVGDYDQDNDIDLLVDEGGTGGAVRLYDNDGNGNFSAPSTVSGIFKLYSNVNGKDFSRFLDVDSDGDLDILVDRSWEPTIYLNDGQGVYSEWLEKPFFRAKDGTATIGDLDKDGDVDIIMSGKHIGLPEQTKIYVNHFGPIKYDSLFDQACQKYISPRGLIWNLSGIYFDTIQSLSYTDSIIKFNLNIINLNTSIEDSTSFLYAPSADTLQWLDCQNGYLSILGETGQVFVPPSSGSYAIEVRNSSCIDTSACFSFVTTDIEERSIEELIMLFPNPNSGEFSIYNGSGSEIQYQILNSTAKVVDSGRIRRNSLVKNDILPSSGIYMLVFISPESRWTKKIIVEK